MKRLAPMLGAAAVLLSSPAAAQDALGDWHGTLGEGLGALRLAVHISRSSDGALTGTLDSPDQNAFAIPLGEIDAADGKLRFTVPAVRGTYEGTWDAAGQRWQGVWNQGTGPLALALLAGPLPPAAPLPADWQLPSDEALDAIIAGRNALRPGQGVVIGVLSGDGERIVGGGPQAGPAFDGRTLFEIGSITKVFTALILADMANKGEVALDDPAEKYLPAGHRMPERGRKITLADLAAHVSGLPRLPDNMVVADPDDPYADYTEARLLAFLDRHELQHDVGSAWEYSNLGAGLLGYLLARAAGTDYPTLLRERITGPLGMVDTAIALTPELEARLAPPLDMYLRPAKPWHLPALMGAGAIRSTAVDILIFADAALDPRSPIGTAMETALGRRVETGDPRVEQALGWQVSEPAPGRKLLMHNGGTGGFRAALALEPARERAVVVLINSAAEPSATDLALHVLAGTPVAATPPLPPAPPPRIPRTEVSLPRAELERVVGRYDFGSGVVFNVTLDGTTLRAQREGALTGPVLPIFPEAPLQFFYRAVDAEVRFIADETGRVTGAVFSQDGQELQGTRLEP